MKRLRLLKYPWHTGHDYELSKIRHDFLFLSCTPREWDVKQRPIPPWIEWVPTHRGVDTDAMVLHVDHWTHAQAAKRHLFMLYKRSYEGPKIVINHGCNMVDGCSSQTMRDLVEGCYMVCNSATACELWEVPRSRFIRHGMSPEEWPPTDYARHEIVVVQAASRAAALYRNFEGVARAEKRVPLVWVGRDRFFDSFDKYRHFLRSSSIFFQPSYASPNPRARTEAMLTGLAVVTTDSHGESEYIHNGVNGYASNDFDELIDFLDHLHRNPREARRLGRAGRKTAQEVFHIDRFAEQWDDLLVDVVA